MTTEHPQQSGCFGAHLCRCHLACAPIILRLQWPMLCYPTSTCEAWVHGATYTYSLPSLKWSTHTHTWRHQSPCATAAEVRARRGYGSLHLQLLASHLIFVCVFGYPSKRRFVFVIMFSSIAMLPIRSISGVSINCLLLSTAIWRNTQSSPM